jgi:hypothetical protein
VLGRELSKKNVDLRTVHCKGFPSFFLGRLVEEATRIWLITENKKTQEVLPDADPGQLILLKSYCFDWNRET